MMFIIYGSLSFNVKFTWTDGPEKQIYLVINLNYLLFNTF